jgi:hypothetical protein
VGDRDHAEHRRTRPWSHVFPRRLHPSAQACAPGAPRRAVRDAACVGLNSLGDKVVAAIDADDAFHDRCVQALKTIREPLFTVWPVITEAMHLVGSPMAQEKLWDVLEEEGLRLLALDTTDIAGVRALMKKYADLPMDLADAALVRVAEREGLHTVFTLDQADLGVYRLRGGKRLRLLP